MKHKRILTVVSGVLLIGVAFQFLPDSQDDEVAVLSPKRPLAQSLDEITLPLPVTQTAPVRLPQVDDPPPAGPTGPSYDERLFAAGWGNMNSELFNSSYSVLRGYVEQYFAGNIQDREFIGNVAWQLTMRTSVTMNGNKRTVDLPAYLNTAKYAVLSASLLNDSAPIRHLVTSQMQVVGEEESALALAEWAVDRFDDSSTPVLYDFIETRYNSIGRQERELDRAGIARAREVFDTYVRGIEPPSATSAEEADNG